MPEASYGTPAGAKGSGAPSRPKAVKKVKKPNAILSAMKKV